LASLEFLAIHLLDGCLGLVFGWHFDESEASGCTGGLVSYDSDRCNLAEGLKRRTQFILTGFGGEIANIDVHPAFSFKDPKSPRGILTTTGFYRCHKKTLLMQMPVVNTPCIPEGVREMNRYPKYSEFSAGTGQGRCLIVTWGPRR
jgi:hypothetical protein